MPVKRAVLQKFVDPGTTRHSTLEVTWTRYLTTFLQHTNKQQLHSRKLDIYEKCCTFDGPPFFSESCSLKGLIAKLLQQEIEAMVTRVEQLACSSLQCDSLICYFKRSLNGDLHFLFASLKEVHGKQMLQDMQKVSIPQEVSTSNRVRSNTRTKQACPLCRHLRDPTAFTTAPFNALFKESPLPVLAQARARLLPPPDLEAEEEEPEAWDIDTPIRICDGCFLEVVPDIKLTSEPPTPALTDRRRSQSTLLKARPIRTFSSKSTFRSKATLTAYPTTDLDLRDKKEKLLFQVNLLKEMTPPCEKSKLTLMRRILNSVK